VQSSAGPSERVCRTPEEFKAWTQNLGHEQVLTTFRSYGEVSAERQAEIIRKLNCAEEPKMDADQVLKALEKIVRRSKDNNANG
jgi:hypothetical protein